MQWRAKIWIMASILGSCWAGVNPAWADDVVVCDPAHPVIPNAVLQVQRSIDPTPYQSRTDVRIWTAPHEGHTTEQIAALTTLRQQLDALAGTPSRYWKCDGVNVVAMTQAERDVMDAPMVAAQQEQAALDTEITTNDYCTGTLAELETRIDTLLDTWVSARQGAVDAAASNVAGMKALLKDDLIPGIRTALDVGFTKAVKCVRARAR